MHVNMYVDQLVGSQHVCAHLPLFGTVTEFHRRATRCIATLRASPLFQQHTAASRTSPVRVPALSLLQRRVKTTKTHPDKVIEFILKFELWHEYSSGFAGDGQLVGRLVLTPTDRV